MFRPHPVSLLQFGLFWLVALIGAAALLRTYRNRQNGGAAAKSRTANIGIAIQAVAFGIVGFGPIHFGLPWSAPSALLAAAVVLLFGGGAIGVFVASTRAMGKNWSVAAQTRSDHQLVRTGPFAIVRHPIYLALLLYMFAFVIGFGHLGQLGIAVPLYCVGAAIRVREEEKLLRARFGDEHARYVRDVPAFLPFLR